MTDIISILTNPMLYISLFGLLACLYTAWTIARRQYLGVDKLFNAVSLALLSGWVAAVVAQWLASQHPWNQITLADAWVHPRPIAVFVGYAAIALIASRYIMKIRYPYWRTMDMVALSLTVFGMIMVVGWSLTRLELGSLVASVVALLGSAVLIMVYSKIERHGLATGLHLVVFFSIILSARFLIPSWQESLTSVKWFLDVGGLLIGVTIVILRASTKSEKIILQDIPRGVSQGFQETFTRAFKNKHSSKTEKSSQ